MDFNRLINKNINKDEKLYTTPVCELSYENDIKNKLKLLDNSSPALLIDVLKVAYKLNKKLVIELKKDSAYEKCIDKLYEFLCNNNKYVNNISVIMSFEYDMMTKISKLCKENKDNKIIKNNIKFMYLTEAPAHYNPDAADDTTCIDITKDDYLDIALKKITKESCIDGVYLEYQDEMKDDKQVHEKLKKLVSELTVGVWGYSDQLDGIYLIDTMYDLGVSFLNTDLPADDETILNKHKENLFKYLWNSLVSSV